LLPKQVQIKTDKRRTQAAKALKMTEEVIVEIEEKIRLDWSPEQISGKLENTISHERIYQHIWADKSKSGTLLYKQLRQSEKSDTDPRISAVRSGTVSVSTNSLRSLRKRPASGIGASVARDPLRVGKNHQGALVTIVDRVSKFTLIKKGS
jgi:IS30 family transposase